MSIAARIVCGGSEPGLPKLGYEHTGGEEAFTRHYFRRLFERIPHKLLVFDDCHETEGDSVLNEVLANGMAEMPAGNHAIVLSRSPPPWAYARLQGAQAFELLGPQAFLLTEAA